MKEFYTIFYSVTGDIRAKKMSEKIRNSGRTFCDFWTQRGQGETSPYKQFFQVSAFGKIGKIQPVREHRQCLLWRYTDFFGNADKYGIYSKKVGITFTIFEKITKLFW